MEHKQCTKWHSVCVYGRGAGAGAGAGADVEFHRLDVLFLDSALVE